MTEVSYETADGTTGTASVPTGCDPIVALQAHLQSALGLRPDDMVINMVEQGKYMILIYTVWMRFIQEVCSVEKATTEADKKTVQEELRKYIIREQIQELDLTEVYAHYGITTIGRRAFYGCKSLTTVAIPDSVTTIGGMLSTFCTSLTTSCYPGQRHHDWTECFSRLQIVDHRCDPGQCHNDWYICFCSLQIVDDDCYP